VQLYTSPSDFKSSGNILEAILSEPFQFFCRILNDVSRITKAPSIQWWFQSREQVKISWSQVKSMLGILHVVTLSLLRNLWPNPTGVLEHCGGGETNSWFSYFSGRFLLTASLRRRRMSMYIFLFTVAIPVNCKIIPGTFWRYYVCELVWTALEQSWIFNFTQARNNLMNYK